MNSLEGVEDRGCLWAETVTSVRPRSESDQRCQECSVKIVQRVTEAQVLIMLMLVSLFRLLRDPQLPATDT